MAENNLIITLSLDDKASKEVVDALRGIGKETAEVSKKSEQLGKKTEETGKKQKNAFQVASTSLRQFRSQLLIVTAAIGSLSIASAEWARRNNEARTSLDNIGLAFRNSLAQLGKFIAPVTNLLGDLADNFNKKFGEELSDSFSRASVEIKNFNEDLNKINSTFIAGITPATDYFNLILEKQNSTIGVNREAQTSLMELANLTAQVSNSELLSAQTQTQERIALLNEYKENYAIAHQGMAALTVTLSQSIRTNLSGALSSIITGAQTAREAFNQLGQALLKTIVDFMVQKLVAFALEKTLLAGTVASAQVAGAATAAAWAPAALAANIASFGGAGVAAAGSFAGAAAALSAGMASVRLTTGDGGTSSFEKRFHDGGIIRAHNGLAVDEVPIIAQTGEGILSRRGMSALGGNSVLNSLNAGNSFGGGGDIFITIQSVMMSGKDSVRELAEELGFEIDRKLRNARARV